MTDLRTAARDLAKSFNIIQTIAGGKTRIDPETLKEYQVEGNYSDFTNREQLENNQMGSKTL
jgi:hypothetical protein